MQHNQLVKLTNDQEGVARKLIAADIVQWLEGDGWFLCDNGTASWYRKVHGSPAKPMPGPQTHITEPRRVAEVCQGIMMGDECTEYLHLPDQYEGLSAEMHTDQLEYLGDSDKEHVVNKRWRIGFYLQTAIVDDTTITEGEDLASEPRVFDPYDDKYDALEIMHVTTDETEGWHKTFEGSHHETLRNAVSAANLYLRTGERVLTPSDRAIAEVPLELSVDKAQNPSVEYTVTELGYFGPKREGE